VQILRARPNDPLRARVMDAMTTNETSFFRDVHPFEALRTQVLPQLIQARGREKRLSVWCAASSTGQEPYTIAMILRDLLGPNHDWRLDIVGTDLSVEVLEKARAGRFSQLEVNRGLPAPLLVKWFERHGSDWLIKPEVRAMVQFRQMNLIEAWPNMGQFDLVFIRNVLIYFDVDTKRDILRRCRGVLRPDGYLFLGAAETTLNLDVEFDRMAVGKTSCYVVRGANGARALART
jgi:chemotaxis protein methyltransferase CheR